MIWLIFFLVILLLHCSKILLLLPRLPFRSLLTLWLGTLPCGHPKGGALYKGHGSPDAKHKHWLSWVHIVLLTTLSLAHSSAFRYSLQAITKPLGSLWEVFHWLPQIMRQPHFSLSTEHILRFPPMDSKLPASRHQINTLTWLHLLLAPWFFRFLISTYCVQCGFLLLARVLAVGTFLSYLASNFKSLNISTLQALVTVRQI